MSLLDELKALQIRVASGTHFNNAGICGNLFLDQRSKDVELLNKLFILWPKFSGYVLYPVASGGHTFKNDRDEFIYYQNIDKLWDEKTEYGKLRIELLQFCIDYLEKQEM